MPINQAITHGIRPNAGQFTLQLLQVFLVGSLVGITRTVLPELASSDFGLAAGSFLALATFVVVFGLVKAMLNLVAGSLSDRWGRRRVLIAGWIFAVPIPFLILFAPSWGWIILATAFLGVNQGLSWSMALNCKLDLTPSHQRGLVNGLNEFAGYGGVAIAGMFSAMVVHALGARTGLFYFALAIIGLAGVIAWLAVRETRPWALLHQGATPAKPMKIRALFAYASWGNRSLLALNQAGLVEKFTDAIVWLFFPVFFMAKGLSLVASGSLIAIYGVVWGAGQLITGPLSDRIGRKVMIVGGMWLCGAGVLAISLSNTPWLWGIELGLIGIGMAMLYPTLGAAVADHAAPTQRAGILGVYRFWRDLGYAVGGLLLGLAAQWSGTLAASFWLVALAMVASGLWVSIGVRPARESEPADRP